MSNGLVELELVIGAINLFTFRDIDTNVKNAKRIRRLALPLADDVGSSMLGAFIASERSNKVLKRGTMKLLRSVSNCLAEALASANNILEFFAIASDCCREL